MERPGTPALVDLLERQDTIVKKQREALEAVREYLRKVPHDAAIMRKIEDALGTRR